MRSEGGMNPKAKALGKAQGYADRIPTIGKVKLQSRVECHEHG